MTRAISEYQLNKTVRALSHTLDLIDHHKSRFNTSDRRDHEICRSLDTIAFRVRQAIRDLSS